MSTQTDATSHPLVVPTCFQKNIEADIPLRCVDGGLLHAYKVILAQASQAPIFRDMFMLPVPSGPDATDSNHRLAVVDVPEDSKTMELLLQLCYPQYAPEITELPEIRCTLEACDKYQMDMIAVGVHGNYRSKVERVARDICHGICVCWMYRRPPMHASIARPDGEEI